jgi:hypothetical protein
MEATIELRFATINTNVNREALAVLPVTLPTNSVTPPHYGESVAA